MKVPVLDKYIGIEVYCTDFDGIGGKIKFGDESFIVEEIIRDIKSNANGYALYRLEKHGIDTQHVIEDIKKKHGINVKPFGLKDAHAITTQYVIAMRKGYYKEIKEENYSLRFVCYTEPLSKDVLLANKFSVMIKEHRGNLDVLENIDKCTIVNFYGYQRFGSSKTITHLIGREIVKKNFHAAIDLLLMNNMDFEVAVRREYEKSKDPIKALRKIPIRIRRLYVEAYKSYIFNKVLSYIVKEGYELKCKDGDVCFVNNRLKVFNGDDAILAIPTSGYGFRSKSRFSLVIEKVMKEEGVAHKDFYIKDMQEVSSESNFRQALLIFKDFSYKKEPLILNFILQKGGYATILLREIMKPSDPVMAGF